MPEPEQPTWVGKHPVEMTDEELREAKNYVVVLLEPTQTRLNRLSAAMQHLDQEINTRFRMNNHSSVNPALFPDYPLDLGTAEA